MAKRKRTIKKHSKIKKNKVSIIKKEWLDKCCIEGPAKKKVKGKKSSTAESGKTLIFLSNKRMKDDKVVQCKVGYIPKGCKQIIGWDKWGSLIFACEPVRKRGRKGENFSEENWPPEKVEIIVRRL